MQLDFEALNDENLDKLIKLESYEGFHWFV